MPTTLRVFRTGSLDVIDRLQSWITARHLRTVGRRLVRRIQVRTRSGKGVGDRRFTRYTPAYAKRKGVGRGDVNLTSTGAGPHMVDALDVVQVTRSRAALGMASGELAERARIHDQGRGHMPTRRWLGIGRADRVWLSRELKSAVRLTIRGAKAKRGRLRVV